MRRAQAGWVVVVGCALVVACSEGKDRVRDGLVAYAEGEWRCDIDMSQALDTDDPGSGAVQAAVTVEADDDASGTYTLELGFDGQTVPGFEGEWELDGTELEIEALDLATRYVVENAELDADALVIQEDGPHEPVDVDVERDGDTVDFEWSDPWTGAPVTMGCTKD